jgi:tetratricopeptide (TPR) repeat protein
VREETRLELSAAERRVLASLGYAGAATKTAEREVHANLPDIKDLLPLEADLKEAVRLFSTGSAEAAIERLRRILREAPTHAPANWSLAWGLWKQGRLDEGMEVFRSLLAVRPDCHTAQYGLAFMLFQRDQIEEAIPEFLKAIETDAENADAQLHLAESLFCTGRVEEAQAHLNLALRIDPAHIEANQLRAYMQASFGRPEAQARYREALRHASLAAREADSRELSRPGH